MRGEGSWIYEARVLPLSFQQQSQKNPEGKKETAQVNLNHSRVCPEELFPCWNLQARFRGKKGARTKLRNSFERREELVKKGRGLGKAKLTKG